MVHSQPKVVVTIASLLLGVATVATAASVNQQGQQALGLEAPPGAQPSSEPGDGPPSSTEDIGGFENRSVPPGVDLSLYVRGEPPPGATVPRRQHGSSAAPYGVAPVADEDSGPPVDVTAGAVPRAAPPRPPRVKRGAFFE